MAHELKSTENILNIRFAVLTTLNMLVDPNPKAKLSKMCPDQRQLFFSPEFNDLIKGRLHNYTTYLTLFLQLFRLNWLNFQFKIVICISIIFIFQFSLFCF